MDKNYTSILKVKVTDLTYKKAISLIKKWIKHGKKTYICVANTHLIMECQRDNRLLEGVNTSGMVAPDGMPLVWLSRLYGKKGIERVYGPTLMLKICTLAKKEGYKIFLLGGVKKLSGNLVRKLRQRFVELDIVGFGDSILRPISNKDNLKILTEINISGADIVFVGMGCPYQEQWMIENRSKLNANILIGVGAAFDFITGRVKQAPKWIQNAGFEWLFRFAREPKRLWYRYTITNLRFIHKIFTQLTSDFLKNK